MVAMSRDRLARSLSLILLLTCVAIVSATDEQCSVIVDAAWQNLVEHCSAIPRDSLCHGSQGVDATFHNKTHVDSPPSFARLDGLESLHSAALNHAESTWGIAALYVSADLPLNREENGVIILLAGDAEITQDLEPEGLDTVEAAISSAALQATDVYAHPSIVAEVRGQLNADDIALVDARDATGEWLRLVNDGEIAWVQREKLARLSAMDSLPIVEAGAPFHMSAFTFRSSVDFPECEAAAPLLIIQTPADVTVDLRINGVDASLAGLISARQVQRSAISFVVHRGRLITESGTVYAGQSVIAIVDGDGAIIAFSGALAASDAELERGESIQTRLNQLAQANGWREYSSSMPVAQVVHTVAPGDSLFKIARQYETRVDAIIRANGHSAPFSLFAGMEIVVPSPGSGFGGLDGSSAPSSRSPDDCAALRLTSPLHIAPRGPSRYYWDGVANATGYRVDVYDHGSGALKSSFNTSQTSVEINPGAMGIGGALQWEVTAMQNGQPLCSSGRSAPMPHK